MEGWLTRMVIGIHSGIMFWGREASLWVLSSTIYHHLTSSFSAHFTGLLWGQHELRALPATLHDVPAREHYSCGLSLMLFSWCSSAGLTLGSEGRKWLTWTGAGAGHIPSWGNLTPPSFFVDWYYAAWTSTPVKEPSFVGLKIFLSPRHFVLVNVTSWIRILPDSGNKRPKLHSSPHKCEGLWSAQESADWLGPKLECC